MVSKKIKQTLLGTFLGAFFISGNLMHVYYHLSDYARIPYAPVEDHVETIDLYNANREYWRYMPALEPTNEGEDYKITGVPTYIHSSTEMLSKRTFWNSEVGVNVSFAIDDLVVTEDNVFPTMSHTDRLRFITTLQMHEAEEQPVTIGGTYVDGGLDLTYAEVGGRTYLSPEHLSNDRMEWMQRLWLHEMDGMSR